MTDLQLGLAAVGALVVAGVLIYNRLQERSARRVAEKAFRAPYADVLVGGAGEEQPKERSEERREPALGLPPLPPHRDEPLPETKPDPRVDYLVEITGATDTPRLRESWEAIERRFGRRVQLAPADGGGWRAALQMVSREGVVSDAELLEFRSEVETLAAALGAKVAAPEMRGALDAARELDRACADADIQVALHVIGGSFDDALSRLGEPAFRVERRADGVTLVLDVARTPQPARAFEAMARAGQELAAHGGRLADDNGNAVDERALAAIGVELEGIRESLVAKGIEPGGPLALRLFS